MHTLKLYTGISPNSNGKYIYYTSFASYDSYLASHTLAVTYADKYTINNGSIRISTTQLTWVNGKRVTYIVDTTDQTCYTVRRCRLQSDCIIFEVNVDLWGTYIGLAVFDNIDVIRCNRRLGTGLYDAIRATKTVTRASFPIPAGQSVQNLPLSLSKNHAFIVFTVEYAVQAQIFGNINTTEVFMCSLAYIDALYRGSGGTGNPNAVELACSVIGGITETETNTWYSTKTARVLRAYLIPDGFVSTVNAQSMGFVSKSRYGDITLSAQKCKLQSSELSFAIDNNANKQYYVGTPESGLKLTRVTDAQYNVTYRCAVNVDRLQITIVQGDNQMDITANFEVALTLNGGDVTNLAGIKAGIQYGLKTATDIATGNFFGVTSDVLGMVGNHFNGHTINGGDGAIAMCAQNLGVGYADCRYPLGYIECDSINDEQANAMYKGAFFDAYVSSFSDIFLAPLLYGTNIPTYIQANVAISAINTDAQMVIRNALASGVYVEQA